MSAEAKLADLEARLVKLEKRARAVSAQEKRVLDAALAYARMAQFGEYIDDDGRRVPVGPESEEMYVAHFLKKLRYEAEQLVNVRGMFE